MNGMNLIKGEKNKIICNNKYKFLFKNNNMK